MNRQTMSVSIGGRTISFETGKIARQASGSVVIRSGDTMLLATACSAPSATETDFLPLRVDYQEKFSSTGRTLGGFIKREGRPTEKEILVSRLIDRPIRPMFENGFFDEVQLLAYVLSYDAIHSPEPLAICAASAALVISDIPLIKPIAAVRVGQVHGKFVINPTIEEQKISKLDLMLAGTENAILMIEGTADFLTEEQLLEAVEEGAEAIKTICHALSDWQQVIGKEKNRSTLRKDPEGLLEEVASLVSRKLEQEYRIKNKLEREAALSRTKEDLFARLFVEGETPRYKKNDVGSAFKKVSADVMRTMILTEHVRIDGRSCQEIRNIDIELGLLPRTHGSALFTRGETQAIAVCTLGGNAMGQRYEDLHGDNLRKFYLQYSFPPFSVGEVGRIGSPGRREIGHGKLAENALSMILPTLEKFPYTIRLESNITESNGSSSMASICGGCLALMDAGVPVKHPIAGIAMGLILEGDRYAILSDILGAEDALGDMDFKIAGDAHGITAFQLDIKVEGITHQIMKAALSQAKEGLLHILQKILHACPKAREELSAYAPRIETMQVKPSKIGTVIGPGGKQIRAITEETGVQIDIDDSGLISISSTNPDSMAQAKAIIHNLTAEVEVGKTYTGKIMELAPFGAFVAIFGKEGLCHISELSHQRIQHPQDVVQVGDMIDVKVLEVTKEGKIRLSHKALIPASK